MAHRPERNSFVLPPRINQSSVCAPTYQPVLAASTATSEGLLLESMNNEFPRYEVGMFDGERKRNGGDFAFSLMVRQITEGRFGGISTSRSL